MPDGVRVALRRYGAQGHSRSRGEVLVFDRPPRTLQSLEQDRMIGRLPAGARPVVTYGGRVFVDARAARASGFVPLGDDVATVTDGG
jgi:hypothetical protein